MYALRPATEADYEFLYALHSATMKEYVDAVWGWDEVAQQDMFRQRFDPSQRQVIVVSGWDAGMLEVRWGETEVFIANLLLAPAFQRRGIGAAILRDILDEADARGLPVLLRVLRGNPARRLYERLGFVVTEEAPERFYMRREP
jgi:GNAT superfamily N-acetyltransferase